MTESSVENGAAGRLIFVVEPRHLPDGSRLLRRGDEKGREEKRRDVKRCEEPPIRDNRTDHLFEVLAIAPCAEKNAAAFVSWKSLAKKSALPRILQAGEKSCGDELSMTYGAVFLS